MGALTSRDTRRISFDNTFTLNPALNVQKSIADDGIDLSLESLTNDNNDKILFKDMQKDKQKLELQEPNEKDYWIQRMDYLRKEHQLINNIVETEYAKTIENINRAYDIPMISRDKTQKLMPCFNWRSKILQCYEDNPHQPLVCSAEVQAFTKCVMFCEINDQ